MLELTGGRFRLRGVFDRATFQQSLACNRRHPASAAVRAQFAQATQSIALSASAARAAVRNEANLTTPEL
jgi:hypothetical protein